MIYKEDLKKILNSSVVRFISGGSITVLVEYITFYIFYIFISWNLFVSNSLSFCIGLGISFMFNRLWAFRQSDFHRKTHHQMILYAILAVTNFVANNTIVGLLRAAGLDARIGKIIAIIVIAIWNFIVYKKIIFVAKSIDRA